MAEKKRKAVGIHALYRKNPQEADKQLWGREVEPGTRRGFLKKSGLAAMVAFIGSSIPFANKMPGGLIPAVMADTAEAFRIDGKEGLRILNDRPINAETPPHLLDHDLTPAKYFFVRNNGIPPALESIGDPGKWVLEIAGESCIKPKTYTLAQLKKKFKQYSYALTLECGGNGRSEFNPPAKGESVVYWRGRMRPVDRC